jgi:outer membrane lipoprotein carrier protein
MLRQWQILLWLVVVLTAAGATPGSAAVLQDVVMTVEQGYQKLADLQAEFKQKTTLAAIQRTETGGGELLLRRSKGEATAQFRFDYTKPAQQIVSDGKTLWYYVPASKQVIVSDMATFFAGGNSLALTYLTGMGQLSKDFVTKYAGTDKQGNHLLELTPKKPTSVLQRLQLTVAATAVEQYLAGGGAKMPFPLVASVIVDAAGNRTEITYSKIRVNRGLAADRFKFKVPTGVAVVKQ